MKKLIVVGGGPAGMTAAIHGAKAGCEVSLLEQNEKLGKKLFITGKGRCNITNACDVSDLFSHIISNPKFLYSAIYSFTNADVVDFFHAAGLRTKVERGERVFPVSDKSSDVIRTLQKVCGAAGVKVHLNTKVSGLCRQDGRVTGVLLSNGKTIEADAVILATGGASYPSTGADGYGFQIAEKLGHTIRPLRPGLTGILTKEPDAGVLQGLTLKNAAITITTSSAKKKALDTGFGELLFTHYGVSGPLILSASSKVGDRLQKENLLLHIDLKPALTREQLDKRILRDFEKASNLDIKNALIHLLPKSMIPVLLSRCQILPQKKVNEITREERACLTDRMKDYVLTLTGLRSLEEAIITRGGIRVNEVDPSTMQSKRISGLYFAGEMLDVDALTGGFNLQIAWSTGYLAGTQAAEQE